MKKIINVLVGVIIFVNSQAFAHGEEQKGPHGGYIRMPGAFHTEVVADGKNKIKVYLLDIDWKNPTVKNSTVKAILKAKKLKSSEAKCEVVQDYFTCSFVESVDLTKKAELTVLAVREGQKGNSAVYQVPFVLGSAHEM